MLAAHIVASLSFIFLVNISILLCESCGMITGNPSPGKQLGCLFGFYYVETQCTGIQRTLERIIPPAQWYGSSELFMWYAHGRNTAETHKGQPKGLLNQGTFKAKLERCIVCFVSVFQLKCNLNQTATLPPFLVYSPGEIRRTTQTGFHTWLCGLLYLQMHNISEVSGPSIVKN